MRFVFFKQIVRVASTSFLMHHPTRVGPTDDQDPTHISPSERFHSLDQLLSKFGIDLPKRELLQICDLLEPYALQRCVSTPLLVRNEQEYLQNESILPTGVDTDIILELLIPSTLAIPQSSSSSFANNLFLITSILTGLVLSAPIFNNAGVTLTVKRVCNLPFLYVSSAFYSSPLR